MTRTLDEAEQTAETCRECSLWEGTNLVYGAGRHSADLMMIGEAPGKREDELRKPFVGDSGHTLETMLDEFDIRREDIYIANVVKHRPVTHHTPPKNGHPKAAEIKACAPWLSEQVLLVDPKLIVPLGNYAMRWFRNKKDKIGDVHGKSFVWQGRTIIPTFHPAYVLRFPRLLEDYRRDFATIRAALDSLIDDAGPR